MDGKCFFCERPNQKWPKESLTFLSRQLALKKLTLCEAHEEKLKASNKK